MAVTYTEESKYPLMDTGSGNWGAVINSMLSDVDAGAEITVQAGETIGQYDAIRLGEVNYAVGGVDAPNDHFIVTGVDLTAVLIVGNKIYVTGSTGNDGTWEIESLTLNGADTEVYVTGDITDATVDGTIRTIWMYKAQADMAAHMPAVGIAPAAVADGANGKVRRFGWIDDNATAWDYTAGLVMYLDPDTAGDITDVAPDRKQVIGIMKSPYRLLIQIQAPEPEIVCVNNEVVCANNEVVTL